MYPSRTLLIVVLLLSSSHRVLSQESAVDWGAKLSSGNYSERDKATRALEKLGASAVPVLTKILNGNDLETRRRAVLILERIEERLLAEELEKATPLRLRLEKLPLKEALREIERQTGLRSGGVTDDSRTVSLDTGTVPYWRAWQRFCQAAQLEESDVARSAAKPKPIKPADLGLLLERIRGDDILAPVYVPRIEFARKEPPAGYSTDDRHSVRVRVKWLAVESLEGAKQPHAIFAVELRAEPRLQILSAKVEFTKLADAEGRESAVQTAKMVPEPVADLKAADLLAVYTGEVQYGGLLHLHAVPWSQPAQTLNALHGLVHVRFLARPRMMEQANVLQAAGKEMIGKHGVSLKIVKARRTDEGDIQLSLLLDNVESFTPKTQEEQIVRVRPGLIAIRGPVDVALSRLQLLDFKGQSYRLEKSDYQQAKDGNGYEVQLVFEGNGRESDQPTLVMMGEQRTISARIPFVVRSVVPPTAAKGK